MMSYDEWLLEAMCRALAEVEGADPEKDWRQFIVRAQGHLAIDRVMRGLGDRLAYEELVKSKGK